MRRRTREAVRHHLFMLKDMTHGVDVVINPKKSLLVAEFAQISQEIERAFRVVRQNCEGPGKWEPGKNQRKPEARRS
jgi:RNase P protein component